MSRTPSPIIHSDVTTTDSEDAIDRYWQATIPTDVHQDYGSEGGRDALRALYPMLWRRPQIHRGPQETSVHTTLRRDEQPPQYKIVFSYRDPPREYMRVLRRLTDSLRGQHPVLKCKLFTNPTRTDRLAFVYLTETTLASLLQIVRIIRTVFRPIHIDLRTPEEHGRILMRF